MADTIRIDLVTDPIAVVPQSRTLTAGTGLTGGGTLAANRSFALSSASIASLAKADTALQSTDLLFLDPRDYGVAMDSASDQSAAMQACFDYAEANGHPAIVVPNGVVTLAAQLNYDGPLKLIGLSKRGSVLSWTSGASTRGIDVDLSSAGGLRHTCNVEHLSLVTAGAAVGNALDIRDTTPADRINPSVDVSNVLIGGSTNPAVNGWARAITMDGCQGARIENSDIYGKVGSGGEPNYDSTYGIYYANASAASPHPSEFSVFNSTIKYCQVGIHADDMEGLVVVENQMFGVNIGVEAVALSDFPDARITNNHINASDEAIVVDGMFEVTLALNNVYNQNSDAPAFGITIKGGTEHFNVIGNVYENYNTAQPGTGIRVVDGGKGSIDLNDFRRCDSIDTTQAGTAIDLQASSANVKVGNGNRYTLTDTEVADAGSNNIVQPNGLLQGYDADLAAIAALTPSNDDVLQRKSGAWTNRTIAQLIADLAVQKAIVPGYYPNRYHTGENVGTSGSTLAMTANVLYASLFVCGKQTTWTRIAIDVTGLVLGTNIRLGIFSVGTDGAPGTLLLDAGTVSSATTGVKEITISHAMAPGYYYLVAVSDGAPTVRAWAVNVNNPTMNMLVGVATPGTQDVAISKSFTYGALSGASPFGTPTFATTNTPMVMLRIV